ncbi:pyrroline-5-carboxylate reductase [Legionella cardiaca]|uniref:Pyrroline-5-carboxylate reductase n=1 Tax=Legionella cardiaca TaxID=1071983 RepID=A0ABY8ANT3_9GAMM|nr:pyrroline-5-carboxylate reductase [Legionella cardiaca]WED42349.1 pyrroline-5-carboxylate reductase [Legionella cardiaca]
MNISFIGFGNMAQAIANGLTRNKTYRIFAAAPSLLNGISADGITQSPDNLEIIKNANIVILAVKPANIADVLNEIGLALPPESLLISVAAGVSLKALAKHCRQEQAIIRTMPNLPIAIGKGATPMIANAYVTSQHKQWAEDLFQDLGIIHWSTQESDMNPFTALSGSGPAYFFLFIEAMIDAAKKLGLNEEVAKAFTFQTLEGALDLASQGRLDISELRKKVTSPAGTTAAALAILEAHGFKDLLFKAMKAATKRAEQLSF